MKAVILAGGLGTRLSEETQRLPKPMVEIGDRPMLWHIMQIYSAHGIEDFIICLGYRGYCIKEYFANYFMHNSDVTFDLAENRMQIHRRNRDSWRVTLVDTGQSTMTGGRLKRIRPYVADGTFCMTYGDGLADVDIQASIDFHRAHGRKATVTAVVPSGRYGILDIHEDAVRMIHEKPENGGAAINGGFFVLEPEALDTIEGDQTSWEREPLQQLAEADQLRAFQHNGFWQAMDTLREKHLLEEIYAKGNAPWLRFRGQRDKSTILAAVS
ncbi:MAG TPA: glucose-1-phosphate cytidylyltransferase [Alphaproteobacteria bacterium]|nr:glucose-1-phosphate cytidylyltransferase [Alphaproteobacteria bacterium]